MPLPGRQSCASCSHRCSPLSTATKNNLFLCFGLFNTCKHIYLSFGSCVNHKEVGVFNLENSGTHVLWGDLEVEGFVENLVFSSTISDRCVAGISYQLEELVIGLTSSDLFMDYV